MTSEALVFIDGLEDNPIICNFFKLNTQTGRGDDGRYAGIDNLLSQAKCLSLNRLKQQE